MQKCNKHEIELKTVGQGKNLRLRCPACAIEYVNNRRRNQKILSVNYKGGKCEICGYNKCIEALEFHHKDPSKKDMNISNTGTVFSDKVKAELDKCILVCSNCHRELHYKPDLLDSH